MGKYHTKKYAQAKKGLDWSRFFILLPILLTVGLMPFIIRVHVYNPQLNDFAWYYRGAEEAFIDVFLCHRQWWFTAISVYMFLIILFRAVFDRSKLQYSLACIPLGIFAVFAFLSACISKYPHFAFGGGFQQFENVFVLMGYALIVYYSLIVIESEQEVKYIIYTLTASTMALALIGTGQALGFDLLSTDFIMSLIIPSHIDASLSTTVSATTTYMTLFNPNYVGVYVAMLFPFFVILLLFTKSLWERIAYSVTTILLLISLYGSGSKAAFLVIAGEAFIFLIFLRKALLKQWYLVIPAATAIVCIFLLVNQWHDNVYINRITTALRLHKTEHALESIDTLDDSIMIRYKGEELHVSYLMPDPETISIMAWDANGTIITPYYSVDLEAYILDDNRFEGITISLVQYDIYLGISLGIENNEWIFTNQYADDNSYYYLTTKGKFDKIVTADQELFNNYERVFSGRGYIWSVTIPLLKDHLLLGSGADTFATTFPQQDYVRLLRNGFSEQVMSKPHSLYLQIGIQNGVLAMLGVLAFFAIYLFDSLRLYINAKFNTYYEQLGVAAMLATIGFSVMGLSNDSSVTVSPIFWAIAGLGVYVNAQVKIARKSAPVNK